MKISILIMTVLSFWSMSATAQSFGSPAGRRQFVNDMYQLDEYIKRGNRGIDYKDTDSYDGTPYNNPSFLIGNVYSGIGLLATNVALRYNAIADEIEIKESLTTPDSQAKVLTKSPEIFVKIDQDIFVFVPYDGGIEGGGYFQVLLEDKKYDLFKKLIKDFRPLKKASTSITRDIPARFIDRPEYYIVTRSGKFYQLPDKKSKFFKVFSENEQLVRDYVRDNALNLDNEKDLIRLLRYYNSI